MFRSEQMTWVAAILYDLIECAVIHKIQSATAQAESETEVVSASCRGEFSGRRLGFVGKQRPGIAGISCLLTTDAPKPASGFADIRSILPDERI